MAPPQGTGTGFYAERMDKEILEAVAADENLNTLFYNGKAIEKEIQTEQTGEFPSWISGLMCRNGPGKFDIGDDTFGHWFDPLSLMHRFKVENGKVTYQSKYLQSDVYKANMKAGRIVYSGFGTTVAPDPCSHMFQNFVSFFKPANQLPGDNCNVNIWPMGDKYYAITETSSMREIDPITLETGDRVNSSDFISIHTQTGHPHTDRDGSTYILGTEFGRETNYCFFRLKKDRPFSEIKLIGKSAATNSLEPCYYHSFCITENWIILNETPMRLHVPEMIKVKAKGSGVDKAMKWHSEYDSIIHIISKKDGTPHPLSKKVRAKGFISFHHSNAYEKDGHIVLDVTASWKQENKDYTVERLRSKGLMTDWLKENRETNMACRFIFPENVDGQPRNQNLNKFGEATAVLRDDGTVWMEHENLFNTSHVDWRRMVGPHGFEFCRINYENFNGREHRYIWGNGFGTMIPDKIMKVDTHTKEWKIWKEEGAYPSEPVFVNRPGSTDEQDGVLLSILIYSDNKRPIQLIALDPKDLKEIARAKTNVVGQPYAFHHSYLPIDFSASTPKPPAGRMAIN